MKKMILAIASLSLLASGVQAADMSNTDGVYLGLNQNSTRLTADQWDAKTSNSTGIFGGYRVGNLAGEVAYFNKTVDGTKWTITDFSLIPHFNIAKDFDLLGKLGLRHSSISVDGFSSSGTALVYGVGLEYSFNPNWTARAFVDYSDKTGGDVVVIKSGDSLKATTTTLGVAYKF